MDDWSRRSVLAALAGLAGCVDRRGSDPATAPGTGTPAATTGSPAQGTGRREPSRADHDAVEWWFDLGDEPSGGIAVADGTVVLGTAPRELGNGTPTTPTDGGRVFALDAADGTRRWATDVHAPPRPSPVVHDATVYVPCFFSTGFTGTDVAVYAIDIGDGTVRWRFAPDVHKFLRILAATDDAVYAGTTDDALGDSGEHAFAVGAADGERRWAVETGDVFRGEATGDVLVHSSSAGVVAHETASGDVRWRHEAGQGTHRPAILDGTVIVENDDGVAALDATSGALQWQFSPPDGYVTGWELADETVFVRTSDGSVRALEADAGTERWEATASEHGIAVMTRGDAVYVPSEREIVRLDVGDGTERWRYERDEAIGWTRAGGKAVYAVERDRGNFVALDAGDGTVRWEFGLDGSRVSLEASERRTFLATADGFLYGLD